MKIRKILAALLAVILLAAFAACADGGSAPPHNQAVLGETPADGGKITAAEVEDWLFSLHFADNNATPEKALYDLVVRRINAWEAESLGLLPDIEEIRQEVRQSYESIRDGAADVNSEYNYGAEIAWEAVQNYLEYMDMSEEAYLEAAADTSMFLAAAAALHEPVLAKLPPAAGELEQRQALADYDKALAEKYREHMVEDDLLPLLDEVLENWEFYYEVE